MASVAAALHPGFGAEPRREEAKRPLGERLVERGFLARDAIPAILGAQNRWGCRFGEAAIAEGRITPAELAETLAESHGLLFVDLVADPPDASLSRREHTDLYL